MQKEEDSLINIYDDDDFELALKMTLERNEQNVTFVITFSENETVKKTKSPKCEETTVCTGEL